MTNIFLRIALPLALAGGVMFKAGAQEPDSLKVEQLQEAVVGAVRASKEAPFAVTNVSRQELHSFSSTGHELPELLARTPGVLAWSENGVGTGTSYMRIRGAGGSRINVTIDGVPLNSPEDQTVFWANMNSYASFLGSVQIQRGVGSSSNGDGAFGGTVALGSKAPSLVPFAEVNASWGSFNTRNIGIQAGSGLFWKHVTLEASWHDTATDGYMHGTNGRSGSYMASLSWLGSVFTLAYRLIGNYETTGQAWNGVTAGTPDLSIMDGTFGKKTGIHTYADLCKVGLAGFNSLYERLVIDEDDNYTLERYGMSDGTLWPRTTDNFWQDHHILSFAWMPSEDSRVTVAAHYTSGYGWYEEFRYGNKLVKYGISNQTYTPAEGDPVTVKKSDFVRKKGLNQDTYGVVANGTLTRGGWYLKGGISVQQFTGNHYGYLTYVGNADLLNAVRQASKSPYERLLSNDYQYYNSDASKFDGSAFVKASYDISDELSLFADMQYRHVRYKTDGYNDKYIDNGDGTATRHNLDVDERYNFFNPKAGVNFASGPHRAFASVAVANREPERNNFTDNGNYPAPKAERLLDGELGYQFDGRSVHAGATLYYMRYRDQLVQTGELSDIGEALTTNIPDSYRTGVELTAGWTPFRALTLEGNAALSRNRLLDFDEHVEDWDNGVTVIHYSNSALSYSPSAILNGFATLRSGNFKAVWHTSYVSRMYLDNTENKDRSLPGYSLTDIKLAYTIKPPKIVKEIELGFDAYNVFSARAAVSGWSYSAIYESGGHPNENRYYQLGFIPVAPLSFIGHATVRF